MPYLPPLDQLLALGQSGTKYGEPWIDYLGLGVSAADVPELIRLATDAELGAGDPEAAETYGGIHAWRALGQLRAEAAIEPLIGLLASEDDDWVRGEVPVVLGMIGPAALEPLRTALARWSLQADPWVAGAAASGLLEIGQRFPETRDEVVAALARQLRWWARHDNALNTLLVADLETLVAVEAAPIIEEVFAAGAVDIWFCGDWEDVQVGLGLLPERITPKPAYVPRRLLRPTPTAGPKQPRRAAGKAGRRRKGKRR